MSQRVHMGQARTCLRARSGPPSLKEAWLTSISQIGKLRPDQGRHFFEVLQPLRGQEIRYNTSGQGSTLWKPKDGPSRAG